jgi:hypothetical protein
VIAVRVLRDGAVVREVLCPSLPATLGRDPACEVVLADASVSRAHARIERDEAGALVLRDLGSRNSLRVGGRPQGLVPIAGALRARLGRVDLEIEPVSAEATIELRPEDMPALERRRGPLQHAAYLAAAVLGWLAHSLLQPESWSPWLESRTVLLLSQALATALVLPLLAFGLLIALKAAGRPARLADPLAALARLSWLPALASLVSLAAYYVLTPSAHAALEELLTLALLIVATVTLAELRRSGPRRWFRLAWAATILVFFVGMQVVTRIGAEREGTPSVSYEMLPPVFGWPGVSRGVDHHLSRVSEAAREAAAQAEAVRVQQLDD